MVIIDFLILAVGLVIAGLIWRGALRVDRHKRLVTTLIRCLLLACVVVAWADFALRRPSSQPFLVVLEDQSASAGAAAGQSDVESTVAVQNAPQRARLQFAGQTSKQGTTDEQGKPDSNSALDPLESDPARAVRRASALVPQGYVPTVILQTDGRPTRDGLFAAAEQWSAPVFISQIEPFAKPEVCLQALRAPAFAPAGSPLDLEMVVASNHEDAGQLELTADGEPAQVLSIKLVPGENRFTFKTAGGHWETRQSLGATLSKFRDTFAENNARRAQVNAAPRRRVLVVGTRPDSIEPLVGAFKSDGFEPVGQTPEQIPQSAKALDSFALVVLSDVAAGQLGEAQQKALDDYVSQSGGGLVVVGGASTFGAKALANTWLERLLPVTASIRPAQQAPRLALVLIIDKSLSMLEQQRLDLAKEAARKTVQLDLITPRDQVGVLAFSSGSQWISPLEPCGDKREPLARIDTLKAEGETNMGPALERAYLALREADVDRRHVILLTDGVSSPTDFDRIAAQMAAAGITVSTVAVGTGAEDTMLRDISRAAGGRHYRCENPRDMPQILVAETRSAVGSGKSAEFRPLVYRALPNLNISEAPNLRGFASTSPKPGAEILLLAPGGDPLLAWGPHGKGVVLAFTSDANDAKNKDTEAWCRWAGYGPFWTRLARLAMRPEPSRFHVDVARQFGRLSITVDAQNDAGGFLNGARVSCSIQSPKGPRPIRPVAMQQVAPGRYQAETAADELGPYEISVRVNRGDSEEWSQSQTFFVDFPDELQLGPPDVRLLQDVATVSGGNYTAHPQELLGSPLPQSNRRVQRIVPLAAYLVELALALLVIEIALRRASRRPVAEPRGQADLGALREVALDPA